MNQIKTRDLIEIFTRIREIREYFNLFKYKILPYS